MKCPACGFEHEVGTDTKDMLLCRAWAYLYSLNKKGLPTKEQFEAMQREGFLPTHREIPDGSGTTFALNYGHYGWAVDYDWPTIVAKIMATNTVTV